MNNELRTRLHQDGSVTVWSVTEQSWLARVTSVREADLKAMTHAERSRVLRHLRAAEIDELIYVVGGRAYVVERHYEGIQLGWRILLRPQQAYLQGKPFTFVLSPFAIPGAGGYSFNTVAQARRFIGDTFARGGSMRCESTMLPNLLRDCADDQPY